MWFMFSFPLQKNLCSPLQNIFPAAVTSYSGIFFILSLSLSLSPLRNWFDMISAMLMTCLTGATLAGGYKEEHGGRRETLQSTFY